MSLPMHTTYNNARENRTKLTGMLNSANEKFAAKLPPKKVVDFTQYNDVANSIQTAATETTNKLFPKSPAVPSADEHDHDNDSEPGTMASSTQGPAEGPYKASGLGTKTQGYLAPVNYEAGGQHHGIDFANKMGTQIPAFASGVVTEVVTGKKRGDPAYGNYIVVKDAQGNLHRYSHLYRTYVKVGDPVQRGQVISSMGNSGYTKGVTGTHLDYRIKNAAGQYLDPSKFVTI